MVPPAIRPGGRTRLSSARLVTDLPQPLSPISASVPLLGMAKLTPLTARTTPPSVWNSTTRSSTAISDECWDSVMDLPGDRVGGIAQAVADEVEGNDGEHHEGRRRQQPRQLQDHLDALRFVEQHAPAGHRRLDAEPEEAQRRLTQDHRG